MKPFYCKLKNCALFQATQSPRVAPTYAFFVKIAREYKFESEFS